MEQTEVAVVDMPKPELSDEQKFYHFILRQVANFNDKVGQYTGSKGQLQRVLQNFAQHRVVEEDPVWSYPEEKEIFDLLENVVASKFTLFLMGLESQGKIKMLEPEVPSETKEENKDGE